MATIATRAATVVGFRGYPGVQPELYKAAEAATQTFKAGRFLEDNAAGFLQGNNADNDADIVLIANRDGQNGTAAGDKFSEGVFMVPGLLLEMSFLGASDAAHTLAQTDLWVGYQYQLTGTDNHDTIDVTTTTPRVVVVQIALDANRGIIGDDNARVYAMPAGSLCAITPDA